MRVFVAAELPRPVAERLAAWAPRDGALRPVAVESLHLTLAFLGERGAGEAAAAGALLAEVARPVRALALGGAVWLPARRPRVLAVRIEDGDGALAALQGALAAGLARAIGFEPDRRPYLPHVTVARVRGAVGRGLRAAVAASPPPARAVGTFAATGVALVRSHLGRGPARYETLERAAL
ncbi:MAG: RNA 2',3'-cyclic phosphodiesterase [Solirubrobacteraceae bacterium]|nr:RNA 2',3'-cyclic phosphodiesterase [Solirubrobacteraceae bacterium]